MRTLFENFPTMNINSTLTFKVPDSVNYAVRQKSEREATTKVSVRPNIADTQASSSAEQLKPTKLEIVKQVGAHIDAKA